MTKEKEIEAIDYILGQLKHGYIDLGCHDEDELEIVEQAIKKQIHKRVVCDGDDESDYVHCPCCNEIIGFNDGVWEDFCYRNWKVMHCQECGQAMIWK